MNDSPEWLRAPDISPTERIRLFGLATPSPSSILGSAVRYDANVHYEKVKALHDRYLLRTEEQCHDFTIDLLRAAIPDTAPTEDVLQCFYRIVHDLLQEEDVFEPYLLSPSDHSSLYIQKIYRPYLVAAEQFYAEAHLVVPKIREHYIAFIRGICALLPASVFTEAPGTTSIPVIQLMPEAALVVNDTVAHFCGIASEGTASNRLFNRLRDRLVRNVRVASRIDPDNDTGKKPYIMPAEHGGSPTELAELYLRGTPFLDLLSTPAPWSLDQETRYSGHWIIAPPGRGKTTLLHNLFLEDVERNAAIIVLDSKGDLINPIRNLKQIEDRLVIIEPHPDFPLALNPLDIPKTNVMHSIALMEYVFSSLLEAKMTALQSTLFRYLFPAIVECIPNPTLMTFRDIIENGVASYKDRFAALNPPLRQFFDKQFDSKTYTETRNQLLWRLDFLMTNPLMRAMFEAPHTKIDISKEMDAGKVILINNSKELLTDDGAEFFGRFFVALVLSAAQQRSSRRAEDKLPCFFYIDECQNVVRRDQKVATILDECRSQNIALILAHQRTEQIKDPDVLSALYNCALRYANSDDEAKLLADKLRTTPETLRALPRGSFAAYVRDLTPKAITLQIPPSNLANLPQLTAEEQAQLRRRMRAQFCFETRRPSPIPPTSKPEPSEKKYW